MTSETQINPQTLSVGFTLEDFEITQVLGQGGFGITYKATDNTLRRNVAIKEYLPQQFALRDSTGRVQARGPESQELYDWGLNRFVDEARALAMFRHPNICSVLRFIQYNGTAYLVMEFEEGMDLEHWLKARGAPDEERLVKGILVPVLEGLALVHDKGLLHRDIKPDNIFIRRDGSPVLIDFGASRPHGPEAATKLTSLISVGYSPFEQYGSGDRQGPWSDLYALAGTFYRAISGSAPTDAIARQQGSPLEPARVVGAGKYSERFLRTLDKALSLEISERPQSARAFLTQLGFDAPQPISDPDATIVNRAPMPSVRTRRSRLPLAAAGLLFVLAGVVGGYLYLEPGILGGNTGGGEADQRTTPEPVAESPSTGDTPEEVTNAPDEVADAPAGDSAQEAPAGEPDTSTVPEAETTLTEDTILADLQIPPSTRAYRDDQLAGALLAYTTIKTRFDTCRESNCGEMPLLLTELRRSMEAQNWTRGDIRGTLIIENPRRLDNAACPFMIDLRETIESSAGGHEQLRTYCTSNGFDRVLQESEAII